VGAYLLLRVARFQPALGRVRDVAALVVLAGVLSTMVSATIGVASLSLGGALTGSELSAWRVWLLGDMGGDLLVAPALLLLVRGIPWGRRPERIAEAGLMLVTLVALASITLSQRTGFAYLIFPVLVWGALRFRQHGAALGSLIVAGIAVYFTTRGMGPFIRGSQDDSLLRSQSFMGVAAMTALLLAAVTSERERAKEALRATRDELERKVRERTLQLSEAQRVAQLGSWEWDIVADEVRWSDELFRIYGLDRERFGASYQAFLDCLHPDDRQVAESAVGKALAEPGPFDYYHRIVRPDGAVRAVHARGDVVVGEDGEPVHMFGTAQDITERERAQQEADRLKEEFFALVSHELRTPLSSIKGYLELLMQGKGGAERNARACQFLDTIDRNTRRLERLVGDLLFGAQVQSGEFALEVDSVDLGEVLADSVETARPWAEERAVDLTLTSDPVRRFTGDRDRLSQLFDNLVSNALKYTPDGGRVDITLRSEPGSARVRIRDTGIGISATDQKQVYERFFRGAGASEQSTSGVGLGLTISKAIAEAHGGRIEIASGEGLGTTVRVELPLRALSGTDLGGRKMQLVS
jgi:PAS domain S-box-containing protein